MKSVIYYAIGDVHGELSRLKSLHTSICEYHSLFHSSKTQVLIFLGDYVDRGKDSCGVVEFIINLQRTAPFKVICLKGNHESLMLDAFSTKKPSAFDHWHRNGGQETLESYNDKGYKTPPQYHLDWINSLPTQFVDKKRKLIFVHAGIDPESFPFGSDEVHLWTRSQSFFDTKSWINPELENMCVVHGHTPTQNSEPFISTDGRRINIDTGAVYDGKLSAAIISSEDPVRFLAA